MAQAMAGRAHSPTLSPSGKLAQVAHSGQVVLLVRGVVVHHLGKFLPGHIPVGPEDIPLIAVHHAGLLGPGDGVLVPLVRQVGKGGRTGNGGLPLQVVEDLGHLGAGSGTPRGEAPVRMPFIMPFSDT